MEQDLTPPTTEAALNALSKISFDKAPSPGYIVHLNLLEKNCSLLKYIADRSGAKILLALKSYACFSTFPLIQRYLNGTSSSSLNEAMLAKDFFGKEIHVYSPAYKENEIKELNSFAHCIIFNSVQQIACALKLLKGHRRPEIGLRVNPEYSEVTNKFYNPCTPSSRLGVNRAVLQNALKKLSPDFIRNLDGLHFHALCEQDVRALENVLSALEANFSCLITEMKWINFGGGHHITRPGYDVETLVGIIKQFRKKYKVEVYLEPGEAVALNAGVLVVTVLDIVGASDNRTAILDCSCTCHMPDVLEMPYRPKVLGAGMPNEHRYNYSLGGISCLAGDIIGDYSFSKALEIGQRLVFLDMAHYTMVKNTTFNGVPLPDISLYSESSGLETIRSFNYEDYKIRLS